MVKKEPGQYDDVVAPLPVSTLEPGEHSGLLSNGSDHSKHVGTFDVEFDIEDEVLLNWQHARPSWCPWLTRRLPRQLQQLPEWWLRLSTQQRSLALSGAVAVGVLLFCLAVVMAAVSGSHEGAVRYKPQYMSASDSPYCTWTDLYLPRVVRPSLYKLHISSTLQDPYAVQGQVAIAIAAAEATPCVVLHAHPLLNITGVTLKVYRGASHHERQTPMEVKGRVLSSNGTSQQVVLQFPEAIPRPPLAPELHLEFDYTLVEGLDGFYRSSFIDADNQTKVMASTQFESVAARKAFPCFDEPSFKAVFEVKVSAPPPPVVVLSNMPLSHTHEHEQGSTTAAAAAAGQDGHGANSSSSSTAGEHAQDRGGGKGKQQQQRLTQADLITYHFKPTPPMSTYLVAWVMGELEHTELHCELDLPPPGSSTQPGGGRRRLLHGGKHGHKGDDGDGDGDGDKDDKDEDKDDDDDEDGSKHGERGGGRSVSVRVWGTSDRVSQFGLAKQAACGSLREMEALTQVAYPLPKLDLVAIPNFAAGAMENWGLLTYRERALLVDDAAGDMQQHYAIVETVAHETAHQWFGNLASLGDWTELWLNEGLATYLEAVVGDAYAPRMGYLADFFASTTSVGLEADGSPASHPLTIARPIRKLSEIDNWFDSVSYSKGAAVLRMLRAWVNRDNKNDVTGLVSNDEAASAASLGASMEEASHASTREQWYPRLLRRLQQQQDAAGGLVPQLVVRPSSSSAGSDGSSSSSASWVGGHGSHPYQLGDGDGDGDAAAAAGDALVVLPIDAPVPASTLAQQQHSGSAPGARALGGRPNPDADRFVLGLRRYLKAHAYGNSNYTGLWRAMTEATGEEDVAALMSTWTLRRGFPIVTLSLGEADPGSTKRTIRADQVPYHAPRTYIVGLPFEPEMYCNDWSDNPADSSWWIPLPIRLPGANNFEWHSFVNCSANFTVDLPHSNSNPWVLGNTGRFGFYRVNYSEPLWSALTAAATAKEAVIGSIDFAGLLDDAYSLSLVRQLNISVFLDLSLALGARARPELPPWDIGLGWLQRATDILATAALLGGGAATGGGTATTGPAWKDCLLDLRRLVTRRVTKPFIQDMQVPGQDVPGLTFQVSPTDSPELRQLRPKVLEAAGFLGHTQVTNMAVDLLTQQAAGSATISPDVTKAVYALAAASGSEVAYDTLVRMYEEAADAAHKSRLLRALARVTTPELINKTLEYALSPAVRTQDVGVVLTSLAKQGGLGFQLTWEFILTRADDILAKYGVDDVTYSLGRPLNSLAKLFVDEELIERLKELARRKPQILSPTFFEEANEARILNHDWLRFQGADACAWVRHQLRGGSRG